MSKKQLVIIHDLSKLTPEAETQYLRDVSVFIGLDPDLNGLDTIWMQNENGPGQSKVVYARRGTAEILRNLLGIEVISLTNQMVKDSIVFTATGKNKDGRQEIATGSKNIGALSGKALDDAIMSASTRALRRLTMQFTSLGILDESEVGAVRGDPANPASGAQLAGSPTVFPPPQVTPNNAPGRDVTPAAPTVAAGADNAAAAPLVVNSPNFATNQPAMIAEAQAQLATRKAADTEKSIAPVTPIESTTSAAPQVDKPKRARKPRNTVSLDGPEPEVVNSPAPAFGAATPPPMPAEAALARPNPSPGLAAGTMESASIPSLAAPALPPTPPQTAPEFPGKPTDAQMADYRKRVSVYTAELRASENLSPTQKMRAFLTRQSGAAPQSMTTDQWEETLSWFEGFVAKNQMKGLTKYIDDSLGVK